MNTFPCIERYLGHSIGKVRTNKDELIQIISTQLKNLEEIRDTNLELLKLYDEDGSSGTRNIVYARPDDIKDKTVGGISIHQGSFSSVASNMGDDAIDDARKFTNTTLKEWIERQQRALQSVQANKLTDLVFVDSVDLSKTWYHVTTARTFLATECVDCGQLSSVSSLKTHMSSLKCMQATGDRDLRDAGWKSVDASHHLGAIKKAGISFEVRAAEFNVWVEPWVNEAIKQFEKNQGYGGMKLADFLAKMKPAPK